MFLKLFYSYEMFPNWLNFCTSVAVVYFTTIPCSCFKIFSLTSSTSEVIWTQFDVLGIEIETDFIMRL